MGVDRFKGTVISQFASLLAIPVISVILVIIGIVIGVLGAQLEMLLLAVATGALGLFPLVLVNGRANGHLLICFIGVIFTSYFSIPAILRYIPARGPEVPGSMGDQLVSPPDVVHAQWIILIALISLLAGYSAPIGRRLAARLPQPTFEWSVRSQVTVSIFMLLIGWIFTLGISTLGHLPLFQSGFIATLASARLFALGILYLAWHHNHSKLSLILIAITVPISMIFGLFTGSKLQALTPAAVVIMMHMLMSRKLAWRWVALAVFALALIYPLNRFYQEYVIGSARTSAVEVLSHPQRVIEQFGRFLGDAKMGEYLQSGFDSVGLRLDMLGVVSVLVRDTPDLVPFQYGKTIATLFVAPIPRVLWPGKPDYSVGLWITETYSHGLESHTAPTQIGEFYINFGVIGVIAGLAILGLTLRLVHEVLLQRPTSAGLTAALIILYYLCTKFESAVAQQYANILFALGPLFVAHLAVRALQGRSASLRAQSVVGESGRGASGQLGSV